MTKTKLYMLVALLLITVSITMHAQQPELEEIIQFDESFLPRNMCYVNDEDVLVMDERSSPQSISLLKLKDVESWERNGCSSSEIRYRRGSLTGKNMAQLPVLLFLRDGACR